jgi:hypothetical protein
MYDGKQTLYVNLSDFMSVVSQYGIYYDDKIYEQIKRTKVFDSFDLFKMLGFSEVHAVDYSSYEGADIVFNLNDDLPDNLYH